MSNTREMSIAGLTFTVTVPYSEGHVVTAAEAKALNQTRCENISNAMRAKIKELANEDGSFTDEATAKATQLVAEYDAEYQFTLSNAGGGRRVTDPLEKECISVARAVITNKLKETGRKVKDVDPEAIAAKIEELKDHPEVVKLAKARLKERQKLAEAADISI